MTQKFTWRGGTTVIVCQFIPEDIPGLIEKERITSLWLVPSMWNAVLQVPDIADYDLSSLRLGVTGAAIIPLEVMDRILEVAVIGVPDPHWDENVQAIVVLKPGERMTEAEVIAYCKQNLASYKKPKSVDFVDELPLSPAGKVLKYKLREEYEKGGSSA